MGALIKEKIMSEFLPVKAIYTGTDVTALGEAQPDDVMLVPGGGIKFPDGSTITTPGDMGSGGGGSASVKIYEYIATEGQADFTGADENGSVLAYKADGITVSLNGAMLRPGEDYTATDGSVVTISPATVAGDTVLLFVLGSGSESGGGTGESTPTEITTYEFLATEGQTVFSGADANGVTLSYSPTSIFVVINGGVIRPGDDYTATDGTSITIIKPTVLDDEVLIFSFSGGGGGGGGGGDVDLTNYYTKAEVDAAVAAAVAKYLPLTGGTLSGTLHVTAEISSTADIVAFKS